MMLAHELGRMIKDSNHCFLSDCTSFLSLVFPYTESVSYIHPITSGSSFSISRIQDDRPSRASTPSHRLLPGRHSSRTMKLKFLFQLPAVLGLFSQMASAQKSVFAHVVVGNTAAHTKDTWAQDISLAKSVGIDAFVLNIAYPDGNIPGQVANAFTAAEEAGSAFKLFFAFDYLGGGQVSEDL